MGRIGLLLGIMAFMAAAGGCTLFNVDLRRGKDQTKPVIREQEKQEKELDKVKDVQKRQEKTIEKQEKTMEKQGETLEKQQKDIEELKEEKK